MAPLEEQALHVRLGYAFAGLRECWRSEASFRTHVATGFLVTLGMCVLRPPAAWWALVAIIIVLVLAFELINSAIERLIDHLHPEIHPEIGFVKDMAAGAVLLISMGALIVASALIVGLV